MDGAPAAGRGSKAGELKLAEVQVVSSSRGVREVGMVPIIVGSVQLAAAVLPAVVQPTQNQMLLLCAGNP